MMIKIIQETIVTKLLSIIILIEIITKQIILLTQTTIFNYTLKSRVKIIHTTLKNCCAIKPWSESTLLRTFLLNATSICLAVIKTSFSLSHAHHSSLRYIHVVYRIFGKKKKNTRVWVFLH